MGSPAMNFVTAELVREDGPAVTFAGQPIELAVHTANLQFFDPDSGLAIGHPGSSGA